MTCQRLNAILLAVSVWLVSAAGTRADVYACTTQNFGFGGWISEKYILAFDRDRVIGAVLDAPIYQVHGVAIPVQVRRKSDGRWLFRYTVEGVKPRNSGKTTISYSISLNTTTRRFNVSGVLHGADNHISGSGTCQRIE